MNRRMINDSDVSLLGFGGMRFPTNNGVIEQDKVNEMVDYAILNGVNYFDTAYIYHEGNSEKAFSLALNKYERSSYYVADKLPLWECDNDSDMERIFNEQLLRLNVTYFDFYLAHSLSDDNYALFEKYNTYDFLLRKKEEGKIKNTGFSFHGNPELLETILSKYTFDFVQIQLNYYDWTVQRAKEQYEILEKHNMPCIVMEGARGGFLSSFNDEITTMLTTRRSDDSISSWAFRWLLSLPNVYVVLSGMSNMEQVIDNVNTFTKCEKFTDNDYDTINELLNILNQNKVIPCTGCRYCMDCSFGVNIPLVFSAYNDYHKTKDDFMLSVTYGNAMKESEKASNCRSCGICKPKCPQNIDISNELKRVHKEIENIISKF